MWRVTLKGLAAKKLRFVLTGLAVTLGIAFLSGTLVLTDSITRTFDQLFADVNEGTDVFVRSPQAFEARGPFEDQQRKPVPVDALAAVRRVDGVEHAEGNIEISYAQLVDRDGEPIGNPGQGAPAFGFNWSSDERINPFHLEPGGRAPEAPDEIVIDKASSEKGDLAVGETARVLTKLPAAEYEIVGVAKFGDVDSPAGASIVLFHSVEAQRIAGIGRDFSSISVVAAEGVTEDALEERVSAALADFDLEVLTGAELTEENQNDLRDALGFFNTALLVFAGVALFVGSFIIYNTFSIIVAQRAREMALLRAIGASRWQVMASVVGESVVIGLGASALGLGFGTLLSRGLKGLLNAFGMDIPAGGTVVETNTVVWSFVVGTVVTVVSALIPARKASRVPPVAAIRAVAVEQTSRWRRRTAFGAIICALGAALLLFGLLGSPDNAIAYVGAGAFVIFLGVFVLGPLIARPASLVIGAPLPAVRGMTGTLARENSVRNPRRTAATASALMIGVALVGFITIFAASAKTSIAATIDEQVKADFIVTSGTGFGGTGLSPALGEQLREMPEFSAVSPFRFGAVQIQGKTEFVSAFDTEAAEEVFELEIEAGSFAELTDGIAVSDEKAANEGWELGDRVPALFADTGRQRLPIQMIFVDREGGRGSYAMSLRGFERHFRDQLDFFVYTRLAPGVTAEEGRAAVEPLLEEYPTAKLRDQAQFKEDQASQINQIVAMIYVLLALAIVIALIGIANTLALSIYERTRELGLLRAVGMTRAQVRSTVRWESVIISLFGTGLGLAVGLFFGWSVVMGLRDEGFSHLDIAPGQLAVVVVLGALAGVVAAVGPARRAARLDVLEAIAHE